MSSQYVGGLIEPHESDLATLPHPVVSVAACSADLGFQIADQMQHQALPALPMVVGGRTTAFPLVLLHSLAWINLAQYCLEHSHGLKVFQGLVSDYFGATIASNRFAGDGLFFMLDADLDTRVLYWALHSAFFNPAITPPLTFDTNVAARAMESAGLSALILWAKERTPGAIFHVVLRLALEQWLNSVTVDVTVDASNHIKVELPQPGTPNAYSIAMDHIGDDVLIAWCFLHAQSVNPSITSIGDDYSLEVWVGNVKRVETPSVGATLRGEQTTSGRDQVFNLISDVLELPVVKQHPEIIRTVTDTPETPLSIVDRIADIANKVTHSPTVLLKKPSVPVASDLKKGGDAVVDFDPNSTWVLDNESSIPCPAAPEAQFPNAAELGHGSAACVFIKPKDVSTKQSVWLDELAAGTAATDTVDINRGPAYGVNIKIPEKSNVSGKYTVAQLVGNIDREAARDASIYRLIRTRISETIAQTGPGSLDAHSFVVTESTVDPDTAVEVDTGWFTVSEDLPVNISDIIHTDVSSQLSVQLCVPAGSVCKVIRTTDSGEHTVVYNISAFDSAVYKGVEPLPDEPFDAFKYVKLTWTTRSSPAQIVSGIFDLDNWTVYACEQLNAFYNRVATAVSDSQKDVSSGNSNPETAGSSDDDKSWLWLLLLLLIMSASNNQTNVTVQVRAPAEKHSAEATKPDDDSDEPAPATTVTPEPREDSLATASDPEAGRAGDAANPNQTSSSKPTLRR